MAIGKFQVPTAARTPVDRLRESLDRAERLVANLREAGPSALELLHQFDRIAELLVEFEAAGTDVRAERVRFGSLQRQLRRQQRRFLGETGVAFREERIAVQPDRARWWWFVDEAVAEERKRQLRRGLSWALVLVFVCAAAWLAYDRFIAPPPEVQESYRLSTTGEGLVEEGDLQAALAEFEAAAALTPDNPLLWLWQGVIHSELGEPDDAREAFDTARSLYETEVDFLLDRGLIYVQMGEVDAASADVEQVLAVDPRSASAYYLRSSVDLQQGDFVAAIDDLDRAAELAQEAGDTQLEATARVQRAMVMQMWTAQLPTPTPE
jgi:tetratricopeptide (TPR) repeat protein